MKEDHNVFMYDVKEEDNSRLPLVTFDSINETIACNCKKIEFVGIQCRHAVKLFMSRQIHRLPSQYILKRWTKDIKYRG